MKNKICPRCGNISNIHHKYCGKCNLSFIGRKVYSDGTMAYPERPLTDVEKLEIKKDVEFSSPHPIIATANALGFVFNAFAKLFKTSKDK